MTLTTHRTSTIAMRAADLGTVSTGVMMLAFTGLVPHWAGYLALVTTLLCVAAMTKRGWRDEFVDDLFHHGTYTAFVVALVLTGAGDLIATLTESPVKPFGGSGEMFANVGIFTVAAFFIGFHLKRLPGV